MAIGKDFNRQMLGLHLRANRKEVVVGWYASATESMPLIADTSSLIHDFYAAEADDGDPIHLIVDTRVLPRQEEKEESLNNLLSIRAYKSTPVLVQGEPLANLFHEVRCSLQATEAESICLDQMIQKQSSTTTDASTTTTTIADQDSTAALQVSMEKLLSLLEQASEYVNGVVEQNDAPNHALGRQIADTLACVPRIRSQVLDRLFHDSLQDLLMVTYLSNITRTQLTIAEKLNASLGVSTGSTS